MMQLRNELYAFQLTFYFFSHLLNSQIRFGKLTPLITVAAIVCILAAVRIGAATLFVL